MEDIYYKKLFEVRVLHEYYLSNDSASPYFALPDAERDSILQRKLLHHQYDIRQDLSIAPSASCEKLLRRNHIRFVPQKTGFFAGIRVNPDGAAFSPFIPLEQELAFEFTLQIRNPAFCNFTNSRLRSNVPALYLFTNSDSGGTKTFPSLSEPVAPFTPGTFYEMGELTTSGADVREALVSTSNNQNANWRKIASRGLVSESDRLLLPMRFRYTFGTAANVQQASFTLKQNGNTIKTINKAGIESLESVLLDFQTGGADPPAEIAAGPYVLEVTGNNGYQENRKVYLNHALYHRSTFGAILLYNSSAASPFSLLTPTGNLKVPHPVFEVRLKNRITYWRYKSEQGKSLAVTPKTSPYLSVENGALRSIHPLPMLSTPVEFKDETAAAPKVFLPNPSGNALRIEPNGLVYSDIYLSKIKDLIAEA
jgi:hypothetical protein